MAGIWTSEGLLLLQQAILDSQPVEITHFALSGSPTLAGVATFNLDAEMTEATFPAEQYRAAINSSYVDPADGHLVIECQLPADEASEFFLNGIGVIRDDGVATKTLIGIAEVSLQEHVVGVFSRFLAKMPFVSDLDQAITLTFAPGDSVTPTEMDAAITSGVQTRVVGHTEAGTLLQDGSGNTGTDLLGTSIFEATKFTAVSADPVGSIALKVRRVTATGAGGDVCVAVGIYSDNAGVPGTKLTFDQTLWIDSLFAGLGVVGKDGITGGFGFSYNEHYTMAKGATLVPGTDYWIVREYLVNLESSDPNPLDSQLEYDSSNAAATAIFARSTDGTAWTTEDNKALYFKLFGETSRALDVKSENNEGLRGQSDTDYGVIGVGHLMPGVYGTSRHGVGVQGYGINRAGVRGDAYQQVGVYGRSVNGAGINGVGYSKGVFGKNIASSDLGQACGVGGICTDGITPGSKDPADESGGTPMTGAGVYADGRGDSYALMVVAGDGSSWGQTTPECTRSAVRIWAHTRQAVIATRPSSSSAAADRELVRFEIPDATDVNNVLRLLQAGSGHFVHAVNENEEDYFTVTNTGRIGVALRNVTTPQTQVQVRGGPGSAVVGYGIKNSSDELGWGNGHTSNGDFVLAREFTATDWATYATRAYVRRGGGLVVTAPTTAQQTLQLVAPAVAAATLSVERIAGAPTIECPNGSLIIDSLTDSVQLGYYNNRDVGLVYGGGNVRIGATPIALSGSGSQLQISGDTIRIATQRTLTASADFGNAGEFCIGGGYIHFRSGGQWLRVAGSTF